tara:strand:- start:134 stop:274 length:141 start_codon:yes stop_codon:yes gene_type:complete
MEEEVSPSSFESGEEKEVENNERQPRKKASEIIRGLEKKHTSSKLL